MSKSGCPPDRSETSFCEVTAVKSFSQGPRRKWMVKVEGLEKGPRYIELEDPATERSYSDHDTVLFSPPETPNASFIAEELTHQRTTQDYCRSILKQLGLSKTIDQRSETGILQIFINESIGLSGKPSIHALRWELLEHSSFFEACGCSIQVTRIYNSVRYNSCPLLNLSFQTPTRILLVIARSWQLAPPSSRFHEHFADISPDVVQDTLRDIIKICRQRGQAFTVHVAPGGFKGLVDHLEQQKRAGIVYDMVHFDLHGRINPHNQEPELLFAVPYIPNRTIRAENDDVLDFSTSSFEYINGRKISELLDRFEIRVVALNSCQSANSQNGNMSNLSHILMQHNATTVIAMSCAVRGIHAKLFYEGFYCALILHGQSFSSASASGRAHLRVHNHKPLERSECDPESIPQVWSRRAGVTTNPSRPPMLQRRPVNFSVQHSILRVCSSVVLCLQPRWTPIPLWLQIPASLIVLHHTFRYQLGLSIDYQALWNKSAARLFTANLVEPQDASSPSPTRKVGIGRMGIEDLLRSKDWVSSVYIQLESSPMSDDQEAILEDYINRWKDFEFAVNETRLNGPQLASTFWQVRRNIATCFRMLSQKACVKPRIQSSSLGSHLIIVKDFDYIFRECSAQAQESALSSLSRLVEDLSSTQPVRVIVIGNVDAGDRWVNGDINPNRHLWALGNRISAKTALGW